MLSAFIRSALSCPAIVLEFLDGREQFVVIGRVETVVDQVADPMRTGGDHFAVDYRIGVISRAVSDTGCAPCLFSVSLTVLAPPGAINVP